LDKHGESGVIMEGNEEEDDDDNIPEFAEYNAFEDTTMGEVAIEDEPTDDLGQAICDAERDYKSEDERIKFECMLEDHKKLLYPNCEEGQKKLGTTL